MLVCNHLYYLELLWTKGLFIPEELKALDQMEWVRRMNAIRDSAEEVIRRELIYN